MFISRVTLVLALLVVVLMSLCTLPSDPQKNPDNAKITTENVSNLPDSIAVGASFPCSLVVYLPHFIDNISVIKVKGSETVTILSEGPVDDTLIFALDLLQPGNYAIKVITSKGVEHDTLEKNISVYSTTPVATFTVLHDSVNVGDSTALPFTLTDRDGNLNLYILLRDGLPVDTVPVLASQRFMMTGEINPGTLADLQPNNIYSLIGVDDDSQSSVVAICTLTVVDSIYPQIKLLTLSSGTPFTVPVLPYTLTFVITDNWALDTIKMGGFHQSLPLNDTLKIIKTSLDTGTTVDSIEAWDRGGKRSVLTYKLQYHGLKQYPPQLKPLTVAPIYEHATFDTIFLDSYVTITDTAATYTKDSLVWTVTSELTDPLLTLNFNPDKRIVCVTVKDTEIVKDRHAEYSIKVTDPKGLSAEFNRVSFWVMERNDAPVITVKNQSKVGKNIVFDTLTLSACGYDPDPSDRITWTIEAGMYFKPDSIWSGGFKSKLSKSQVSIDPIQISPILISRFSGRVAIIPDTTKWKPATVISGTKIVDSLKFSANDGTVTTSRYVRFTWLKDTGGKIPGGLIIQGTEESGKTIFP